MKVSVIIPAVDGGKYLDGLFKTLSEQTIRPVQVLVIDSSSDGDTLTICKASGADLIRIDSTTFDHGGTRNLAASKAKGKIFVFMTQDTLFKDETCLENLINPLEYLRLHHQTISGWDLGILNLIRVHLKVGSDINLQELG